MSTSERPGLLGGQAIYLRNDEDVPYVRSKVAILPARADVAGSATELSPDPLVRYWTQDDFSGGSGFSSWKENERGYHLSNGVVWDDRNEWLAPGPFFLIDDTFTDGGPFYVNQNGIVATSANGGTDTVDFEAADPAPSWTAETTVKAASTPHTVSLIWDSNLSLVKAVSSYVNGDVYLGASVWASPAFSAGSTSLTVFDGRVFVAGSSTQISEMDGFAVGTSTVRVTTEYNLLYADTTAFNWLTSSDVGPVWLHRSYAGPVSVWEYNDADASEAKIGMLPEGTRAKSLLYAFDGYWVPYLEPSGHYGGVGAGDPPASMWLWYLINGVQGRVGPFESKTDNGGRDVGIPRALGVTDREEIIILWDEQLWSYNVSTTAIQMLADTTRHAVSGSTGIDYGIAHGNVIALTHDNGKVAVFDRSTSDAISPLQWFDIDLGEWNGDYPGVNIQLESVTIVTEPLSNNTGVVGYVWYDGSYSALGNAHETNGETQFTWYPSQLYPTLSGDRIRLRMSFYSTTTGATGPFVRSVSMSVVPAEAHLEWDLAIDLGDDRSGRLDSKVTADWLWGLGNITTFVDPWSVREHEAGETHNVRVLERQLGPVGRDGPQFARVKLRKVERV